MKNYPFSIPCLHGAVDDEIAHDPGLPDYHPLTSEEIASLLNFAKEHDGQTRAIAAAQIRLSQAVPGATCPHSFMTHNFRQASKLQHAFLALYKFGGEPDVVKVLETLIAS